MWNTTKWVLRHNTYLTHFPNPACLLANYSIVYFRNINMFFSAKKKKKNVKQENIALRLSFSTWSKYIILAWWERIESIFSLWLKRIYSPFALSPWVCAVRSHNENIDEPEREHRAIDRLRHILEIIIPNALCIYFSLLACMKESSKFHVIAIL